MKKTAIMFVVLLAGCAAETPRDHHPALAIYAAIAEKTLPQEPPATTGASESAAISQPARLRPAPRRRIFKR